MMIMLTVLLLEKILVRRFIRLNLHEKQTDSKSTIVNTRKMPLMAVKKASSHFFLSKLLLSSMIIRIFMAD